jgi:enoyl-CoA hydratase/carnithine racemase
MAHYICVPSPFFLTESPCRAIILRLTSADGTNRLTRACVLDLTAAVEHLKLQGPLPLVIAGNRRFFSVGADLNEIAALTGPEAYEFSVMGQALMHAIASYPAPVIAAIEGHCMGGGLDLALACHRRIAAPHAFRTSRRRPGSDDRMGRHATVAAADRQRQSARAFYRCGKDFRRTGA